MSEEPVIGRAAILFMTVVFFLVVLGATHCSNAHAISKNLRPECLPSTLTESCSVSPGSTDRSGFITIAAKRKGDAIYKGNILGGLMFHCQWDEPPMCEFRGDDADYPKVRSITTKNTLEVVMTEDARLPAKMRWFYVCR